MLLLVVEPYYRSLETARRYAKERGLTSGQVTRWGLGYATGGYYANRILLPTRNPTGTLLNITGRAWSTRFVEAPGLVPSPL